MTMKWALLALVVFTGVTSTWAGPEALRFTFTPDRDKEKEDLEDSKYGDGKITNSVYTYKCASRTPSQNPSKA